MEQRPHAGRRFYYAYDAAGSLRQKTDADGRFTFFGYYGYDASRRPTTTMFQDSVAGETADPWIYYAYDSLGNMTSVQDQTGTFVTDYDALNRVVTKRTLAGSVYYQYDRSGKKTLTGDPDSYYTFDVYDAAGRLTLVQLLDTGRTAYYFYDPSGKVTVRRSPGGIASGVFAYYTYDSAGRLATLNNYVPLMLSNFSSFNYVRDANANISYFTMENGGTTYYAYDALDRLTKDERRNSSNAIEYGFLYNYDPTSNRYFKFDQSAGITPIATYYFYDGNNRLSKEWTIQ